MTTNVSEKKKMTALLLNIFGGGLGLHHFYLGNTGKGVLYLFTAGLLSIGSWIDVYKIATDKMVCSAGLPLAKD